MDLVKCPSVSRTSAVARTFGPAVSEEYSPVVFAGGRLPMHTPWLLKSQIQLRCLSYIRLSQLQRKYLSCLLPVVSSRPFFLGKVALDVVGLCVGPPCLRVDSEEILLTLTDERAPSARAAPGVTPVDSSETRTPVRELMWPSVLGESSVVCLQEPIHGMKSLEYAIQVTASVWMSFEQVHNVVSGDVDFDSFGMAPWDAGGIHGDRCQLHEAIQSIMLQWSMQLLCRPVIVHGLDRNTTMNMENELDMIILITTDSPRLTVTPGECYASDETIQTNLQHTHDISATEDCNIVELKGMIFLWLNYLTFRLRMVAAEKRFRQT